MKPIRLASLHVPANTPVRIVGLRQSVTIAPGPKGMFAAESLSPSWSFPDGNIAWKLRFRKR